MRRGVVIAVVMMSSRRPNNAMSTVPMASRAAMLQGQTE